jgi:hypothetical protein
VLPGTITAVAYEFWKLDRCGVNKHQKTIVVDLYYRYSEFPKVGENWDAALRHLIAILTRSILGFCPVEIRRHARYIEFLGFLATQGWTLSTWSEGARTWMGQASLVLPVAVLCGET